MGDAPDGQLSSGGAGELRFESVTKRYPGMSRPAVDDLTFTVPPGKVLVLVGPSGCGKTTVLKMVNRLIEPSDGRILINGVDVTESDPAILRRAIGYVIQQVGLMPHLTIARNVGMVPRLLKWHRGRIRARVDELLELIGLPPDEYRDRYPAQLSGGQQQRVGLARALAADPPVMLMDEPFSAVDPITRDRLQDDFLELHRAVAKTVVFVSHDIDEAVKMADLIAVMREGALVQLAPPDELLESPADAFVADFVGADRALKRLSLSRVSSLELMPAPALARGTTTAELDDLLESGELEPVEGQVLITDGGRPLDWIDIERVRSHGLAEPPEGARAEPVIKSSTTLRDALSALLTAGASHGIVVDGEGRVSGLVPIDALLGVGSPIA